MDAFKSLNHFLPVYDGSRAQVQLHCDLQSKYKGKFSPDSKIERKTLKLSDVSM